jgi:uncharacterized SAM-binding protein YcdF (DUF218 family)
MIIKKLIIYILTLCCILFLCLQFLVIKYQNSYTYLKSDAIVVLGHSLEEGIIPSSWLSERLETGLNLYNSGFSDKIIVTGGQGKGDLMPVAISMQIWLIEHGVPLCDIITETQSKNTFENFKNVKIITDEMEMNSIIIATNDFHMYRSNLIAKSFYKQIGGKSSTINLSFKKILAYLKEPLSILKYLLLYK